MSSTASRAMTKKASSAIATFGREARKPSPRPGAKSAIRTCSDAERLGGGDPQLLAAALEVGRLAARRAARRPRSAPCAADRSLRADQRRVLAGRRLDPLEELRGVVVAATVTVPICAPPASTRSTEAAATGFGSPAVDARRRSASVSSTAATPSRRGRLVGEPLERRPRRRSRARADGRGSAAISSAIRVARPGASRPAPPRKRLVAVRRPALEARVGLAVGRVGGDLGDEDRQRDHRQDDDQDEEQRQSQAKAQGRELRSAAELRGG